MKKISIIKRSSFLISQSLVFWLLLPSSLAFSQTESKNGWRITPEGDLRVLIIFAEIDYGSSTLNGGTSEWQQGALPSFADDWYDKTWTGSPQKEMTKYFYEMSLGHYRVTGDYINSIVTIDLSDFTSSCSGVVNALEHSCDSARNLCGQAWYETELLSHDGIADAVIAEANTLGSLNTSLGFSFQDFDAWNHPSSAGAPRSPTGNDAYDHVMIVLRNWKCQSASTARYANFPQSLYGKDADTWSVFNTTSFDIRKHEYGHLLLGDNGFHASGGHDRGNSSYYLSTQCGWGLMGNAASTIKTVNAWERRRLGWRASGRTMDISCLDGATEVNTDLDASDPNDEGSFKIRDFVITGDAIRIKLPFIPGSEFQQWLWIENHQGVSDFDNHDYRSCQTPFKEGLYVYVQADKETLSGSGTFGGYADYIKPLSASGMHDIEIEGEHTYSNCDLANEVNRIQTWKMANPLSGYSDYQQTDYDKNGDGHLIFKDREGLHVQSISGNPTPNWAWRGHSQHAFHNGTEGNTEVGISTNPSTASHTTLVSNDNVVNLPPSSPENNRTIYINGISVEITNYNSGTGEIRVNVEFDQTTLDQDTRWCGDDIVLPNMASVYPSLSNAGWSLMMAANKTLDIDRSKMPSRIDNPDTIIPQSGPWEYLFNDPTTFRMAPDAKMKAYEGSEINVKNGSSFILGSGNELDIENGTLNILSGSKLILNKGSLLDLSGSAGEVYIDPTSTLIIRGGADIHLDGYESELIIEGTVIVEDSGSLSFLN